MKVFWAILLGSFMIASAIVFTSAKPAEQASEQSMAAPASEPMTTRSDAEIPVSPAQTEDSDEPFEGASNEEPASDSPVEIAEQEEDVEPLNLDQLLGIEREPGQVTPEMAIQDSAIEVEGGRSLSQMRTVEFAELALQASDSVEEASRIAGSIRRKQPMVGDIELVAIPKTMPDLFGTPMETTEVDILLFGSSFVNEIYKDGSRYKQFTMQAGEGNAYQVDLFLATPENWGYILMLRTGPSDFSRKMVTPIRHGGLLPPGLKVRDGYVWNGARIVCVQTEHALFAQWGMEYIAPEERR